MKFKNLLVCFLVVTGLLHASGEYSLEVRNAREVYKQAARQLGKPLHVRALGAGFGRSFIEISMNFDFAQESMSKEVCFNLHKNVTYESGMVVTITAYLPQAESVPVAVPVESRCTIS